MKLEDAKIGLKVRAKTKSVKPNSFYRFLNNFPKRIATITHLRMWQGKQVVVLQTWFFLPEDLELVYEDRQLRLF